MKLLSLTFILVLTPGMYCFAQINMADSTAQVVSYWDKGEVQQYTITTDKYKIKGNDTTSHESSAYDVDVTVIDSTEKSYTVQWVFKNGTTTNQDPIYQRVMTAVPNVNIVYKTDELGVFSELVNWKEIKEVFTTAADAMKKEYQDKPGMDKVIDQIFGMYSSKEAIEGGALREIQQFHYFHGGKYQLGDVSEVKVQVPNLYGGAPFDSDLTVYLDEINEVDNNYIMRSEQIVDPEQLRTTVVKYLSDMLKAANNTQIKPEDLEEIKSETTIGSRLHGSGWLIYSIQTRTVNSGDVTNVEERVIEIK